MSAHSLSHNNKEKQKLHVKLLRTKRMSWDVIATNHLLSQHELTKPATAILYGNHTCAVASVPELHCVTLYSATLT
jgi:hypothetical protein